MSAYRPFEYPLWVDFALSTAALELAWRSRPEAVDRCSQSATSGHRRVGSKADIQRLR